MIEAFNVTVAIASDIHIYKSVLAIHRTLSHILPRKILVFTSKIDEWKSHLSKVPIRCHVEIIKSSPLNSLQCYSNFIIYELHKYIETSHCLIIQHDGFAVNHRAWKDSFLEYDYIGAPFVPRRKSSYSKDSAGNFWSVGNGGFSLRSARLLQAPTIYNLKDNTEYTSGHEDGFFCVYHRSFLEKNGFVWADSYEALHFSIEKPSLSHILTLESIPFGSHGRLSPHVYRLSSILNAYS